MAQQDVTRKLAAILVADVVGYSRLMEADEGATIRTLDTYRQVIDGLVADHRGRVFGSAGDSVIVEFASPVEAVGCAADIQRELERRNADLPEASDLLQRECRLERGPFLRTLLTLEDKGSVRRLAGDLWMSTGR